MTYELMGALTLMAGCLSLVYGHRFAIVIFLFSTLLGSSAASVLTALGSANLQPAHLLLGFLILIAVRPPFLAAGLGSMSYPRPGFWFLVTVGYGVLSALFMPRLFEGASYVYAITRVGNGKITMMSPVGPSNGNLTQTIYFVGNLICFCVFSAFARNRDGQRCIADAFIFCAYSNIVFALIDYFTFATGTASALAFMRNASYNMLDATELSGMKRIVGSFTEASAFAAVSLTLFAFNLHLWINHYRSSLTGPISILLLAGLLLSTSTTAYLGTGLYVTLVYAANVIRVMIGDGTARRIAFLTFAPLVTALLLIGVALNDGASFYLSGLLDQILFMKGASDSALERGNWNSQAMTNFFDSYGLGIGVGSARASSFLIASLASIGILGTITYWIFISLVLVAPWREVDPEIKILRGAAGSACLGIAIAACVSGSTVDLGLMFYALAALAATPMASFAQSPARLAATGDRIGRSSFA